jgi:hypothetical protein
LSLIRQGLVAEDPDLGVRDQEAQKARPYSVRYNQVSRHAVELYKGGDPAQSRKHEDNPLSLLRFSCSLLTHTPEGCTSPPLPNHAIPKRSSTARGKERGTVSLLIHSRTLAAGWRAGLDGG